MLHCVGLGDILVGIELFWWSEAKRALEDFFIVVRNIVPFVPFWMC